MIRDLMKFSTLRSALSLEADAFRSPANYLYFSAPVMLVVLAILVVAFQVNRQLYDQEQVYVGRLAHTASYHTAQLQREHLRLYALIEGTDNTLNETEFQRRRDLIETRIRVMQESLLPGNPSKEVNDLYYQYVTGWWELQPQLTAWQAEPGNRALKAQITAVMEEIELHVNESSILVQQTFEDQITYWAEKSFSLNRLLTVGSAGFAFIIIVVAYTSYLFLRYQAANEQTLRKSEQRLSAILAAIPDAVYRVNGVGILTDIKPPTNEMPSWPKAFFIGKSITDILPADAAKEMKTAIATVLRNGSPLVLELAMPDAKTEERDALYEARLLPSGNDEVQIIVRDITVVKQQEKAALQAQKLESLGVLAGGIAHDFNNLLTGIMAQASLAATKAARGLPVTDNIQKVLLSAERAADLTRQLLAYTGKGKFQVGPLDVNQIIRDTTSLMETALPSHATLQLILQEALPSVHADHTQIQQVVMNLFINAIEALPDGHGAITISTSIEQLPAGLPDAGAAGGRFAGDTLKPGTYVVIKVADTGCGMDQGTLSRIFDPFFTTKAKGHGLGLSATMGVIRTHGGTLQVHSQPGAGTTFTILLPAISEPHSADNEGECPVAPSVDEARKSVLVIDDEADVCGAAKEILEQEGYRVETATAGHDGVAIFRSDYQQFGLLLLDLKMPGMDGHEVYRELQQIQPDLKVVFTSGYSETEVASLTQQSNHISFLPKPYSAESLLRQVGQLLLL